MIQRRRNALRKGLEFEGLTTIQAAVLSYCLECWLSGFVPSYREIGDNFGWTSPNASWGHAHALMKKGWIEEMDGKHGIILSDRALQAALGVA